MPCGPAGPLPSPVAPFLLAPRCRREVLANDLPAEVDKDFIHVGPPPSRRLVVWSVAPALRHCKRPSPRHGAILLQVRFVAHDDEGDSLIIFDPYDLLPELVKFVQAAQACNREDEQETMACVRVRQVCGKGLSSIYLISYITLCTAAKSVFK